MRHCSLLNGRESDPDNATVSAFSCVIGLERGKYQANRLASKEKRMRRIIVSMFLTLDGVIETPEKWVPPFATKEIETLKFNEVREADALLLGERTYQIFANSWPSRTGEFAERMNNLPKHVVS